MLGNAVVNEGMFTLHQKRIWLCGEGIIRIKQESKSTPSKIAL